MSATDPFSGASVIVTGASSGIGRELALRLLRRGARVTAVARREVRLRELAEGLEAPERLLVAPADLAVREQAERVAALAAERFGGIDVLINNAGASMNARFAECDIEVHRRMMDVNYFGTLYLTHAALPHLVARRGRLFFVSSIVGKRGFPTRSGYSAAKFALHGLFESLRVELSGQGVYVGILSPGYTETEIRSTALDASGAPRGEPGVTRGDVMSAAQVAERILRAIATRRRETVLTAGGGFMVWLNKLLPALADRVAARVIG